MGLVLGACNPGAVDEGGFSGSATSSHDSEQLGEPPLHPRMDVGVEPPPDPPDPLRPCPYEPTDLAGLAELPSLHIRMGRAAVADLNDDVHPDVVIASKHSLKVYWGGDEGLTFVEGPTIFVPNEHVGRVGTAKLHGAEWTDLLLYDLGPDPLLTFENLGDGVFAEAVEHIFPGTPRRVVSVDANDDGSDELSYKAGYGAPLYVAFNQGDGSFGEPVELAVSGCYVTGQDWGDFDGKGRLDVALVGGCNSGLENGAHITSWLNAGDQVFEAVGQASVATGDGPDLLAADFDGDGQIDVATSAENQETITLHQGQGDGMFSILDHSPKLNPHSRLAKGRLDGDSAWDLIASGVGVDLYFGGPTGFGGCHMSDDYIVGVGNLDLDPEPELITSADGHWRRWDLVSEP